MPKHAVSACGQFIGKALSNCSEEADAYSKRLSDVLEASWKFGNEISNPIDISAALNSFHSRSLRLFEVAQARR